MVGVLLPNSIEKRALIITPELRLLSVGYDLRVFHNLHVGFIVVLLQ